MCACAPTRVAWRVFGMRKPALEKRCLEHHIAWKRTARLALMNELPQLARLTKVPLREVWSNEASTFTPWLELPENLEVLAEALGLSALQPHSREQAVGRYFADLLCAIGDTNEFLLIENQIDISDHKHLGQLLTYISGSEGQGTRVRYVAWLAEDFRDEHREAVEWLNERLDEKTGFFARRIEVWRIGESEKAPRFDVIVEPRQILRATPAPTRRSEPQGVDVNRVAYWGAFSDVLSKAGLPLKIRSEPPRMGYYTFTLSASHGLYLYVYREVSTKKIGAYVSCATGAPRPFPVSCSKSSKRRRHKSRRNSAPSCNGAPSS
jgi:hypothetical protein